MGRSLVCALGCWLAASAVMAAERPNILFILADDVGCEPLGCYGGTSWPTPNIDELAAGGMMFRHCYSMPVCHPTRVCLLTGRYPMHIGNPGWGSFPKPLEPQTLAHVMSNAGYATAVAGKWQLTQLEQDLDHPHRLGFEEYCLFGWHEGPRYHDPLIWQNGKRRQDTTGKFGPDLYVDFLIDFIKRNRSGPFFAFYSMALCHDVTDDLDHPVPYVPGRDRYLNYGEMILAMDDCVGRLVDSLDEMELRESTLIVFSGDNGTAKQSIIRAAQLDATKPWRYVRDPVVSQVGNRSVPGGKGNLTDDGTNVPLIANWKNTIAAGQVVADLVDFSDFLPTFGALGGGMPPAGATIDGVSFAPRLIGTGQDARSWAFSQGRGRFWVRNRRWKLYSDGKLYEVGVDPAEARPVSVVGQSAEAARARHDLQQIIDSL